MREFQRLRVGVFTVGIRWFTPMLFLVAFALSAKACNIPVFRYALERWKTDPVEIVVFGKGDLPESDALKLKQLSDLASGPDSSLNAKLIYVDVTKPIDASYETLWSRLKHQVSAMPYLTVCTKGNGGRRGRYFRSPLRDVAPETIIRSAVRDELKRRLLAGHSVVWLLIKSPDATKNDAATKLLRDSFRSLQSKIKLPEGIGLPGSELYADVPLVMRFSVLEIDPKKNEDPYLIDTLTSLGPLPWQEDDPKIVPVFGRGRALEVLPARLVDESMVRQFTEYLAGACSCQVKEQNPGFDLLIHCEWDSELFGGVDNRPPDRSNIEGTNQPPTLVPIPPGRK
ncbi:hypothetical protein [Roseiconus lacunae]|uniref:TIGR03435 family protein n=1 Tax=Roseiconus lacunae TaxID=2605694 RepID=A0ABT7PCY6_9BACT|nr:hypothetical protein [Roseiconus lacunae]MDM4014081.1 hypothetical protein [Roseiconus lacunae]